MYALLMLCYVGKWAELVFVAAQCEKTNMVTMQTRMLFFIYEMEQSQNIIP